MYVRVCMTFRRMTITWRKPVRVCGLHGVFLAFRSVNPDSCFFVCFILLVPGWSFDRRHPLQRWLSRINTLPATGLVKEPPTFPLRSIWFRDLGLFPFGLLFYHPPPPVLNLHFYILNSPIRSEPLKPQALPSHWGPQGCHVMSRTCK